MSRAVLVAALAVGLGATAAPARASVWSDATGNAMASAREESYQKALKLGDDAALQADQATMKRADQERQIDAAITLYTAAAETKPTAGEPYARIGKLLFSMYFEACEADSLVSSRITSRSPLCPAAAFGAQQSDPALINTLPKLHARAEQLIAAWATFEARSPMDPRIDHSFLFERAILNTKLATTPHLEAAARDYEAILRRYGGDNDESTYGNLAETYMMLGRLDDAIARYERAVAQGGNSAAFGLAVALDRDERNEAARNLILEAGPDQYRAFLNQVASFTWFFVPPGEKFYYLALCEETFGELDAAYEDWQKFIKSGAHPMYQPRAKSHLAQLDVQRKVRPKILRPTLPFDPFDE